MEPNKLFGMEMRSMNILILRKISEITGIPEAEHPVTFMQGRMIEFLHANQDKEIFQRDIEQNFEIRRPTASKLLQSMEKRGLIKRQGVDYDARLKQVILTEKAIQLHAKMVETVRVFESNLIKGLTEEELSLFFDVIDKVKRNLSEI